MKVRLLLPVVRVRAWTEMESRQLECRHELRSSADSSIDLEL